MSPAQLTLTLGSLRAEATYHSALALRSHSVYPNTVATPSLVTQKSKAAVGGAVEISMLNLFPKIREGRIHDEGQRKVAEETWQ